MFKLVWTKSYKSKYPLRTVYERPNGDKYFMAKKTNRNNKGIAYLNQGLVHPKKEN